VNAAEAHQQELERRRREEELLGDPEYVAWLAELLAKAHTKIFNPNQGELFHETSSESRW
jgi:hypothetical protein